MMYGKLGVRVQTGGTTSDPTAKKAVDDLHSKDIILIFPSTRSNNKTVRVLKTPKTESSIRRVYIPRSVALCLVDLKKEQDKISVTYKLKLSGGDIKAV